MNIAIVATLAGPGPLAGGVWRVVETHAEALAAAGHDVRVLAGWLGPTPRESPIPCATLVRVHRLVPTKGIRFLVARNLRREVETLEEWSDVMHVHLCRDHITTMTMHMLRKRDTSVIAQAHGMLGRPTSPLMRAFDKLILRSAHYRPDKYLSLGIDEISRLTDLGIERSRIHPIHNAVSEPTSLWSQTYGTPHFVFASRLHERKQPAAFVMAALQYMDSGATAKFTLAGQDQGELRVIQKLLSSSRHKANIRVVGAINNDAVRTLLTESTAMVLPSLSEPYPMIVLEALAAGTPTIVSDQTGVSQLLADRDAAIVIPPTVENIASSMSRVAQSETLRTRLSHRGRKLFLDSWTQESVARSLVHEYQDARLP